MFYTYILKSTRTGEYYIGYTGDLYQRLYEHNKNRVKATRGKGPWKVFNREKFLTEYEAIRRERQIKSWKSRRMIERLKF
ncbi:MAG: GIY-YIG nuclease family protein [Candidatus Sungbacteria bacterium]|nr:GIY-YIG nuclease family protein [Candidatus Sungbacteria bacterium]